MIQSMSNYFKIQQNTRPLSEDNIPTPTPKDTFSLENIVGGIFTAAGIGLGLAMTTRFPQRSPFTPIVAKNVSLLPSILPKLPASFFTSTIQGGGLSLPYTFINKLPPRLLTSSTDPSISTKKLPSSFFTSTKQDSGLSLPYTFINNLPPLLLTPSIDPNTSTIAAFKKLEETVLDDESYLLPLSKEQEQAVEEMASQGVPAFLFRDVAPEISARLTIEQLVKRATSIKTKKLGRAWQRRLKTDCIDLKCSPQTKKAGRDLSKIIERKTKGAYTSQIQFQQALISSLRNNGFQLEISK